ncbi:HAD family phosphatase [Nakamurella sp. A5-74]|uniref:HAD family phosphatase n=1 Tax=Nakamurella sp. A5-74 TaxID=3158264 RepID=A0AAU8DVF8_9ACTN
MIRAVVLDLDGVIRRFDTEIGGEIERRHTLDLGLLGREAFAEPDLAEATTGRITRAEWIRRIGRRIGNPAAADDWGSQQARVDWELLDLVGDLRAAGLLCAVLTNGTDTIPQELASLGVSERVDRVFNSASIGFIKPDQRVFEHVIADLGLPPSEVFFTDDSPRNLVAAQSLGMHTHHYRDLPGLRRALLAAGVTRGVL